MRNEIDAALAGLFQKYDASPAGPLLDEIGRALNRRRYISNLVREVTKELGSEKLNVHPAN